MADGMIFNLYELQAVSNEFKSKHKYDKKVRDLCDTDYINIMKIFFDNKEMMEATVILRYPDDMITLHHRGSFQIIGFEVTDILEERNIGGIVRIFDSKSVPLRSGGCCVKMEEQYENVLAQWDDGLCSWKIKYGSDNPDLYLKLEYRPLMGYPLYELKI